MRITWENLDSLEYIPAPGLEYEVAQGCIRRLRRPAYDVMRAFMAAYEDGVKPDSNGVHSVEREDAARMLCFSICTEGDDLPEGYAGVDVTIATRAVGDFFTFRIPRPSRPPKS